MSHRFISSETGLCYPPYCLYLRANGANGSTTFKDDSPRHLTMTAGANTTISTTNSKFGGSSIAFAGAGNSVGNATKSNFNFLHQSPAKYSIAMWYRSTSFSGNQIIIGNGAGLTAAAGMRIAFLTTRKCYFEICRAVNGTYAIQATTTNAVAPNDSNWHYMVINVDMSLASANVKYYIDGSLVDDTSNKTGYSLSAADSENTFKLGGPADGATTEPFLGNMDDVRISVGYFIDGTKLQTRQLI